MGGNASRGRWLLHWQQRRPSALRAAKQSRSVSGRSNQRSILQPATHEAVQFLQSKLAKIPHTFLGATSAQLQGANVPDSYGSSVQVSVQWDFLQPLHQQLVQEQLQPSLISHLGRGQLGFSMQRQGLTLQLQADRNTVVAMDPNRVQVSDPHGSGQVYWCESLLSVRQGAPPDLAAAVDDRLQQMQAQLTANNAEAWSQSEAEGAWLKRLGSPEDTAAWIRQDPWLRLGRPLFKHLPEQLSGLKLMNLMGSHGTKAVAAAVLGAQATCVDISPVNAAYGSKVAAAAAVEVDFVVADVLQLPPEQLAGGYHVVLLELGVLHYFIDLAPLMTVIAQLLRPGGTLLLREFHPVDTKLLKGKGKARKVAGDYFSQGLVSSSVAYSKYADAQNKDSTKVLLRQWGLGEVVTAVCEAGLVLQRLEEEPTVALEDAGLPKLFTLIASRPMQHS